MAAFLVVSFCHHLLPSQALASAYARPLLRNAAALASKMTIAASPQPPVAKKVEHSMELFGDVRVDNYYWLRDDSRSDPEVLSYLRQENEYTESVMSGVKQFKDQLFAEIKGRIQEDDISAPIRKGPFYYYQRNLQGKEYAQYCRCPVADSQSGPSVYDDMPTGPGSLPEHVLLDENIKALNHSFYSIGNLEVSPNNKLVAYAEDTKGDEIYTVYVIDAETGAPVGTPLKNVTGSLEWAGNEALVYTTMDETLRPDKVWLHKLETEQSDDKCLYHEKDDMFYVDIKASESEKILFVSSESKNTSFVLYLDNSKPDDGLATLTPRVYGVDTSVSHRGDHFFIKRRTDEFFNSEVLVCPIHDLSSTTVVIPHRERVKIQDVQLFINHLVVYERENGLVKAIIYKLPPIGEPIKSLQGGQSINFADPVYCLDSLESQFSSNILRFTYGSLKTPPSVYHYDMDEGISVLKKKDVVLGGFDESTYTTERKWATAYDGTQVPISIVYQKNLVKLDGSDSMLLYGYGSYEACIDPYFKSSRLSLLDRGFIYAIAHIRGGGEMGRPWYENGKLMKKNNTFTDFIASAEYLIENKYTSREKLCIEGRSAGGLLIGAVLNMRPDLFKAAVAGVPFVDVVTTMLDPTIPLTTSEWEEWGDPRKADFYFYMKAYSPVDNVTPQHYPHILVTAGLNDPRVMYSEPAKFVAKLRDMKKDSNLLLFKCELGAGHFSKSGRFEKLEEDALTQTFLMKALDMIPNSVG
ncbi:hypothetical protein MLD38_024277 [Melastoma candidum]|uniref:Uncharacterized protein n=1 Tax=Melastoma candidum TaxID=119954 RepID=A0ACB9NYI9_9MYRT|nr:hypothetical protein MLD38_024277 [Melastoma candidum]